jgi:hypothetical protein
MAAGRLIIAESRLVRALSRAATMDYQIAENRMRESVRRCTARQRKPSVAPYCNVRPLCEKRSDEAQSKTIGVLPDPENALALSRLALGKVHRAVERARASLVKRGPGVPRH